MKKILFFLTVGFLLAFGSGCTHEKYGKFTVEAINTASGVAAGMSEDGELVVMSRDDQRQAIFISGSRADQLKIYSCESAPYFYIAVHLFGKKNTSILKVVLPPKGTNLKFYTFKEVGDKVKLNGKKVWIVGLKEVSPDGKELRVLYEVEDLHGRKTGTYYPETNTLSVR